jgi:hypothetical protein
VRCSALGEELRSGWYDPNERELTDEEINRLLG